jgi:uncharacterized RDD family membrane protein YckC
MDETAAAHKVHGDGRVAGFWIRVLADALDAVVLGVIGWVITLLLPGVLHRFGERAAILGAPITLVYTGVLQSHIGRGQTLAKRLLGLRVLRIDGNYLSLDRSLVRWAILGTMVYGSAVATALGGLLPFLDGPTLATALGGTQAALVLGCYLTVPFHPLKRGLHDLLTGSIVIRGERIPEDFVKRHESARRDRMILVGALVVAILATAGGLIGLRHVPQSVQPAARVSAAMEGMGLENPGVVDSSLYANATTVHRILVSAYLPTDSGGQPRIEGAEDKVLAVVRKEMPLEGVDTIVVQLRKGVNVGIFRSYDSSMRVEPAVPGGQAR